MRAYEVFKHQEQGCKAVKRGFSWPGFFFTYIWALSRQLWVLGGVLMLASLPVSVFIVEASQQNPYFRWALAFAFQLIIGFKGNSWRGTNLQDRGFQFLGAINARDSQDALAKVAAAGGTIPAELKAVGRTAGFFSVPPVFQRILAIVGLTWKAAFRYRLFWVLTSLLLAAVVGLPVLIKDDGTAEGFTQILLTYTLGAVTAILGICTLWLACGTLARDIEECQIQMLAVKPIARWQIWLGKWLGLLSLNAVLLTFSGLSIYGLLEWRAKLLPPEQQLRLQNEVLVARASMKEDSMDKIIETETEKRFAERLKKSGEKGVDLKSARQQLYEQVKAEVQVVPPDRIRPWVIHLGPVKDSLKDQRLFLRVKFNAADYNSSGTFYAEWQIGVPPSVRPWASEVMSLAPDTFHEFPIPANLIDEKGDLTILFHNPNQVALLFPLDEGMEVLYREGGFGLNFARGLGIILCWMALLATVGLASASLLSFPVAAFFSLALLVMGLSSGTLSNVVQEGTVMGVNEEKGIVGHSVVDMVVVPFFRGMLRVIQLVQQFSPIDALSTGRSITWTQLGLAVGQIVILLGGVFGLIGIFIFSRRELATAQGNH
jgi:hypothetical protein